ncbi:MAG: hypothetical protein ABIP39_00705 [Polyangiaceae bacterium]
MRFTTVSFLLAAFLVAGGASAAGEKGGGKAAGDKGSGGAGGGAGGASAGSTGGGGVTNGGFGLDYNNADKIVNPDKVDARDIEKKKWEVSAGLEVHRLIRQSDLNGAAENKQINVLAGAVEYDFTKYDRLRLRAYLLERFIGDPGETGWRADDLILQYTRYVPLAWQMTLKPGVWVTAPTSFRSQKEGNITSPRLFVSLEKEFGRHLRVEPRGYGEANIDRYRESELGGTPNLKYRLGFGLSAEYSMPFHPALSLGVDLAMAYLWYYDVGNNGFNNSAGVTTLLATNNAQQPIAQTYGGEVFVRYILPSVLGFHSDASLAYAQGDPTIGYTSLLHDGNSHVYAGYRQNSELYATLTIRY